MSRVPEFISPRESPPSWVLESLVPQIWVPIPVPDPGFFDFESRSRSRIPDFLILMRPGPSPGSQIFQLSVPVPVPDLANFEFEFWYQSRILNESQSRKSGIGDLGDPIPEADPWFFRGYQSNRFFEDL